jgi:hypothetical protein
MSKSYDLYPFLISRNSSLDYQVIVAPNFLVQNNKLLYHLKQAAPNEKPTEVGIILHRSVNFGHDFSNNFTLLYRIDIATKKDIGENSEEVLKEPTPRDVHLIQGVVCKSLISVEDARNLKISDTYWDEVRISFTEQYKKFWHNRDFQISSSNIKPLPTDEDSYNDNFRVQTLATYYPNNISKELVLIGVGMILIVLSGFFLKHK